jgi:membrane-associated phospholipid phosphatase
VQNWDHQLFWAIHDGLSTSFLDVVAPLLREKLHWIPVYLALAGWLFARLGPKKGTAAVLFLLVAVALANTLAAEVIKPWVGRERPCRLWPEVEALVPCGSGMSFPSAHSANHFALSLALWMVWPARRSALLATVLAIWAFSVAFAQVYVGVHFPADALAGALVGMGTSAVVGKLWARAETVGAAGDWAIFIK